MAMRLHRRMTRLDPRWPTRRFSPFAVSASAMEGSRRRQHEPCCQPGRRSRSRRRKRRRQIDFDESPLRRRSPGRRRDRVRRRPYRHQFAGRGASAWRRHRLSGTQSLPTTIGAGEPVRQSRAVTQRPRLGPRDGGTQRRSPGSARLAVRRPFAGKPAQHRGAAACRARARATGGAAAA